MTVFLTLAAFSGAATAQGTAGLLGVGPGFPQVEAGGAGEECSFDSATGELRISGLANLYFPDPNTLDPITGGSVLITATLDATGNPTSGSLTISGTTDAGLTDPLLTADITALGLENTSPNPDQLDRGDLRATPTGGSIFNGPDWPAGFDITASLRFGLSTYDGSVATSWGCDQPNILIGAEFFPAPVATMPVAIEVLDNGGCLRIDGNGVVTVAILASGTLDIDDIDRETLNFQGLDVATRGGNAPPQCDSDDDVNGDGLFDLVCEFQDAPGDWLALEDDNIATLWGELEDGTSISGAEEVCLVGKKKSKALSPYSLLVLIPVALARRRLRKIRGA